MKKIYNFFVVITLIFISKNVHSQSFPSNFLNQSSLCLPTITTTQPTSIGLDSVVIGGSITNDGGSTIVQRGICYSTTPNPNMGNMRTEDGSGIGSFSTVLRGLITSTTYFARSYAKNSVGVVVYGNEVNFSSTPLPGLRCPGTPTVTDIDGNVYNTVQIGNQCWTQSNLKTSRYRNGDSIPTGLSNSVWQNTTTGAYTIYNNDLANDNLYGKMYNHYAVADSRGLCPTGWHISDFSEWQTLKMIRQGYGAGPFTNVFGGDNFTGFTGLLGGALKPDGEYLNKGNVGMWWTNVDGKNGLALMNYLWWHSLSSMHYDKNYALSVRCVKDTFCRLTTENGPPVVITRDPNYRQQMNHFEDDFRGVSSHRAMSGGYVISDSCSPVFSRGIIYSTDSTLPFNNSNIMNEGSGIGIYRCIIKNLTPLTTYYVRAFAINSIDTSFGEIISFKTKEHINGIRYYGDVQDADGNNYKVIEIGNQRWLQRNLKTTKYSNGDSIPFVGSPSDSEGYYFNYNGWYQQPDTNGNIFGRIYSKNALLNPKGICPTGFRVPNNSDWHELIRTFRGLPNSEIYRSLVSEDSYPVLGGWSSHPWSDGRNNSSGFSARPGGRIEFQNRIDYLGLLSSFIGSESYFELVNQTYSINQFPSFMEEGYVRCIKINPPVVKTGSVIGTYSNSAIVGCTLVSDGGEYTTRVGISYSTSNSLYLENEFFLDNRIGFKTALIQNLQPNTKYYYRAFAINSSGWGHKMGEIDSFITSSLNPEPCPNFSDIYDIDSNLYQTLKIGSNCWLRQNLKASRYRNGDSIISGLSSTAWQSNLLGAYAFYNDDSLNNNIHGKLYNYSALTDNREICPTGWRIPNSSEWQNLISLLGKDSLASNSLSDTNFSSNQGGWLLPNPEFNNSSGFAIRPAGIRMPDGQYQDWGITANYWIQKNTNSMTPPYLKFQSINPRIIMDSINENAGLSVRCIKDNAAYIKIHQAREIMNTSVLLSAEVTGLDPTTISTTGFCYSTMPNPLISHDTIIAIVNQSSIEVVLRNLQNGQNYYVRAFAIKNNILSYSDEITFKTTKSCASIPSVLDIDYNVYPTVEIGNQCWLKTNLKVSRYRNGDIIPSNLHDTTWESTRYGASAVYGNTPLNDSLYGKLYNYPAVIDTRGICPTGWRVPSVSDYKILAKFVEPTTDTFFQNYSISDQSWWGNNTVSQKLIFPRSFPSLGGFYPSQSLTNNSSGFSAFAGGIRNSQGDFYPSGNYPYFHTSDGWIGLNGSGGSIGGVKFNLWVEQNGHNQAGNSVRCIKE